MLFPTILPTDLSFQQTHPYTDSRGRVCSANAHLLSLQVRLGLLEPQLAANQVLEHPPGPGSRKARPGPSLPPTAVDQTHGQGMGTPVAIPQCTVPQRDSSRGASRHQALIPGTAGYSTAHRQTRARLPLAPSVFTHLSGRASSLIPSFSAPVSLLLPTPTLLNHVISILKEKCSGGGGIPGSLLSHTYEYVNTFFLKKEKKSRCYYFADYAL